MAVNPYLGGMQTPQQQNVARVNALNPAQKQLFVNYVNGLRNPAPAAPVGQPGSTFVLPGVAEAEFGAQRQNIGETYQEQMATNNFQQQNAALAQQRAVRDQADQYSQVRGQFEQPYFNRGLGASGIYRGDLGRLVQMRQRQMNDTSQDFTRQQAGFTLNRESIERRRALALANLGMKHQALLGQAASGSIK